MLVLVVKMPLQAGKKEEFIRIARPLIAGSQKEAGNIEYNLYEELDEPDTVAFIEKWRDQAALDFHEKTEHFLTAIGQLKSLCAQPPTKNRFDIVK